MGTEAHVKNITAGKSAHLAALCKPILGEQHQRLANKNTYDVDLVDDLRTFIKVKCNIERDYTQALMKLISHHQKKYPTFTAEADSDVKSLYTAWKSYMDEVERCSKSRLGEFEQFAKICDQLKDMKTHKSSIAKKSIDNHLKKMQDEVAHSVVELDKHRKFYLEEEHVAKQARDKEEKLMKRKGGIFSKFTGDLQTKKEKSSAQREATEIESTHARNEYLMSLAATNAHLNHFYILDLPALMKTMDDDILDKCRGFILNLLQCETTSLAAYSEGVQKATLLVESSSADITNNYFLSESTCSCLREALHIDFEPCDGDTVTVVSTEFNQDLALESEITKWMSCFSKECRNLNRLSLQLVKCQDLQSQGHKTVEVRGTGQVSLETQVDEIKQQIRKCDISKAKAYARLYSIKESGMAVEDLDALEASICSEMKQVSSLDVESAQQPLSRTPSLRSTKLSDGDGRVSAAENKSFSDNDVENPTPEPDNYMSRSHDDYDDDSDERDLSTPAPNNNNNSSHHDNNNQDWAATGWSETNAVEEPIASEATYQTTASENYAEQDTSVDDQYGQDATSYDQNETAEYAGLEEAVPAADGMQMVGKLCRALYAYQGPNEDDLELQENEEISVVAAADADWVTGQNSQGQVGYVPAAYLEIIGEAPPAADYSEYATETALPEEVSEPMVDQTAANAVESSDEDYVRALYDYEATSAEEITFCEGDLIKVIERSDDGWWTGEKDGIRGHFPSMVVEDLGDHGDDAFEESDEEEAEEAGSCGSATTPTTPVVAAAPPSFAPPKPVHLTPHQIVIMQPTPVIENKTFGDEVDPIELEDVSADDGIGEDNSDDITDTVVQVPAVPPPAPPAFTLDDPPKRPTANAEETEEPEPAPEEDEEDGGAPEAPAPPPLVAEEAPEIVEDGPEDLPPPPPPEEVPEPALEAPDSPDTEEEGPEITASSAPIDQEGEDVEPEAAEGAAKDTSNTKKDISDPAPPSEEELQALM